MRCTVDFESRVWPAIWRTLQCVPPFGFVSSVLRTNWATRSSLIGRGRPGRNSSCSPATPCSTKRLRHLPTVAFAQSQLPGNLLVHLSRRAQQNDSYPSHQSGRKRTGTGHAFQLRTLLRAQHRCRFRSSHRHRHLHCASETPVFLAILMPFTYGTATLVACQRLGINTVATSLFV